MTIAEHELAMIGFASERRRPAVWRTKRIAPRGDIECEPRYGSEPGDSPELAFWRAVLARGCRSLPYRITRVAS